MKPTIAFYDAHPHDQDYFHRALGSKAKLIFVEAPLSPDTVQQATTASIISTHITSHVSATVLQELPQLRHVACRTTGYDHVDLAYARKHHIGVSNVPSYGEATVAEYAFLLLLAVSRRLMLTAHAVRFGGDSPEKLTGHDLDGKTLGLIGTGRIGRHAARIARGFGMTVIAYDPFPNEAAAHDIGYQYVTLDQLLAQADAISLHTPATPQTQHLLDAAAFGKMKPGVLIINTARGTLIDTPALIQALQSGRVAGAGLDVIEGEEHLGLASELQLLQSAHIGDEAKQILGIDILQKMPTVLITAHNAYNSAEALDRIRTTTVANIRAALAGHPQNLVA